MSWVEKNWKINNQVGDDYLGLKTMLEEQMHHTNAGFQGKPLKIYHRNWYCPVSGSNVLTILTSSNNITFLYKCKVKNSNTQHFFYWQSKRPHLQKHNYIYIWSLSTVPIIYCQKRKPRAVICSIVGPLQFLIHINNLHEAIMVCSVHHFVDNINLLIDKSLKKINKHINHELKYPNRSGTTGYH